LLEFLTILPEEVSSNSRIPLSVCPIKFLQDTKVHFIFKDQEFRDRSTKILTGNAPRILELLSMYINATGEFRFTELQSTTS
jgi:transportin-3